MSMKCCANHNTCVYSKSYKIVCRLDSFHRSAASYFIRIFEVNHPQTKSKQSHVVWIIPYCMVPDLDMKLFSITLVLAWRTRYMSLSIYNEVLEYIFLTRRCYCESWWCVVSSTIRVSRMSLVQFCHHACRIIANIRGLQNHHVRKWGHTPCMPYFQAYKHTKKATHQYLKQSIHITNFERVDVLPLQALPLH